MFLFAFTNSSLATQLACDDVEELIIDSRFVTIVTDRFLSRATSNGDGFSVIEAPSLGAERNKEIIFSRVVYSKRDHLITVDKTTISGRPVYYTSSNGDFFCSSHISMLRKAGVVIAENTQALPEFFTYSYILPPQTLYQNIFRLSPGSRLEVRSDGDKCRIKHKNECYPPPITERRSDSLDTITSNTLNCLSQSVGALGIGKERLAVMMSGGLDSSILFKLCENDYGDVATYSTEYPFEDPGKNIERKYALSAADAFGSPHTHFEVTTGDYLSGLVETIAAGEEPLRHLQYVMYYLLVKKGLPQTSDIIISGEGSDSIWGLGSHYLLNSSRRVPFGLLSNYTILKLLKASAPAGSLPGRVVNQLIRMRTLTASDDPQNICFFESWGNEELVCRYFNTTRSDIIRNRADVISTWSGHSVYDIMSMVVSLGDEAAHQQILSKSAETVGKIVYYPFSRREVLDYAYSIPWKIKIARPKNVLRRVAQKLEVPEFIIKRRKSGFGLRRIDWAQEGNIFEPLVRLAFGVFGEREVRSIQDRDPVKAMTFWNMLNYAIWKRLCVNNEPLEVLIDEAGIDKEK